LKQETLDILKQVVKRSEAATALVSIENERFTERDLLHWTNGSSVEPGAPVLDKVVLDKVTEIIGMKATIAENKRKIEYNKRLIDKVFTNQGRLRENIKSLERARVANSDLMKRYLSDLEKDEDFLKKTRSTIESIENETVHLEKSIVQKKGAIVALVKNMKGQTQGSSSSSLSSPRLSTSSSLFNNDSENDCEDDEMSSPKCEEKRPMKKDADKMKPVREKKEQDLSPRRDEKKKR